MLASARLFDGCLFRQLLSSVVCLVALSLSTVFSAQTETLDRILAVVAGHVIMQSDVRAFVDLQLAELGTDDDSDDAILTYLIERRLVLDEVDRYVVANPPRSTADRLMTEIVARFPSEEAFQRALKRVGFTTDDLRQILQDDARREAYLDNRFGAVRVPTNVELREYYDEHREQFVDAGRTKTFDEVRFSVLEQFTAERRDFTVAEWVSSLVRRGQVIRPVLVR
jgi:hypothetical protein